MNMKSIKLKCCLVATVAVAFATFILTDNSGYSQENYSLSFDKIHHTPTSAVIPLGTTVQELQIWSDNIVRGRILNDARIVWEHPDWGHNFVSLEILEVIKGDIGVGDIITLVESYYILDGVLITYSNYLPSIPYQEYFFFLTEQITAPSPEMYVGAFWLAQSYRSRFHIPNSRADISRLRHNEESLILATTYISNLPLEEAILTISDIYMSLWQEVIGAYMDWSRPPVPSYMFHVDNISSQEAAQQGFGDLLPLP